MSDSGFQQYSHYDFIKQLHQLLEDRYRWEDDGFAVIKELIQNANDAGAENLHLGWMPGCDDESIHPLLSSPALFAVNDGPFSAADANNITRLGSNSKAGEAASAGRFGLGLKSVFHIAEAFFYWASPFENSAKPFCRLFNPWSPPKGCEEKGPYEHWDFQPEDRRADEVKAAIGSTMAPVFCRLPKQFCLWIPLRENRHLTADPIVPRNLLVHELERILSARRLHGRLAELLPLLHRLREIHVWGPSDHEGLSLRFSVRVTSDSTRPSRLPELEEDELPKNRNTSFAGQVVIAGGDATKEATSEYAGQEQIYASPELSRLWDEKKWPPDQSIDPETLKWREHRVKLIPHGALRFMTSPVSGGSGQVSMRWCVFLPLGGDKGIEHSCVPTALESDVSIYLHGYFFIDAGRNRHLRDEGEHLDSTELDVEQIRQRWNRSIEQDVIWPMFLDAFESFVGRIEWSDDEIQELTSAVGRLLSNEDERSSGDVLARVCAESQWLYGLTMNRRGVTPGRWSRVSAETAILEIPHPPESVDLLALLPGLASVPSGFVVTFARYPRISADTTAASWPTELLSRVVTSLSVEEIAHDEVRINYLADFLDQVAPQPQQRSAISGPLLKKLAYLFKTKPLKSLEEMGRALRRLIGFNIPRSQCLPLPWADSERRGAEALFGLIAEHSEGILALPACCPREHGTVTGLSSDGICSIIRRLPQTLRDATPGEELLGDCLASLLEHTGVQRERVLEACRNESFLPITEVQTGRRKYVCYLELKIQCEQRRVFLGDPKWTSLLQAALGPEEPIWRISRDFAGKVLGENHDIPQCSAQECAATLCRHPAPQVGPPKAREALLNELFSSVSNMLNLRIQAACRLLLHGCPEQATSSTPLFVDRGEKCDGLATKMTQLALRMKNESWRLLSGNLGSWAESLSVPQRERLQIQEIRLAEAARLIDGLTSAQVDALSLSDTEYAELLLGLDSGHNGLLRRLPIHTALRGSQRVAIDRGDERKTYWDNGYRLEDGLQETYVLLKPHRDKQVRSRQEELTPVLGPEEAVRLALGAKEPSKHWPAVIKAVADSEERFGDELIKRLKNEAWLPTRFGPRSPRELLCFTEMESTTVLDATEDMFRKAVDSLVEKCDGLIVPDWQLDEKCLKHTGYRKLRDWNVLPDETTSLQHLSVLLGDDVAYRIGHIPLDVFETWLAVEWEPELMPTHRVLKATRERFGTDRCFHHAAESSRQLIEVPTRVVEILRFLASKHQHAATQSARESLYRIFVLYLKFFLSRPGTELPKALEPLRLPSQLGEWRKASEICLPTDGIAEAFHLHSDLVPLLEPFCARIQSVTGQLSVGPQSDHNGSSAASLEEQLRLSSETVRNYFEPWEQRVPNDVIGGILCLLGDDERMRIQAQRFLGKRTIQETRLNMLISRDIAQFRMDRQRFLVELAPSKTVTVKNLLGADFEASLSVDDERILVGFGGNQTFQMFQNGGFRFIRMRLRPIGSIAGVGREELVKRIENAAERILVEAYAVRDANHRSAIRKTFEGLANPDQLEISITQQMILEGAVWTLSQLGLKSDEIFGPVIAKLTGFLRRRGERVHNEEAFGRRNLAPLEEVDYERSQTDRELRDLLEGNQDAHQRCLRAVRSRIQGHNQYDHRTIPFELFQNADDAAAERHDLEEARRSATFFRGADRFAIRHFGRRINKVPEGADARDDQRSDDLWKMLTLWLSNKDTTHDDDAFELTGKFGLGFKSVFLASDEPRILSGRLACTIFGGVYPRHIPISSRDCFEPYLIGLENELRNEATIIEVPLRKSDDDSKDDFEESTAIFRRFESLAHILVAFSRQIRRIDVVDVISGQKQQAEWLERPIEGVTGCVTGRLTPLAGLQASKVKDRGQAVCAVAHQALLLKVSHNGALLFVHDGRRLQPLPDGTPTFWVTAPTQETLNVGFAINAQFALDPGRARLGGEASENDVLVSELGRELGDRLASLFERNQAVGWEQFRTEIGLDHDAEELEFWDSLWEMLGPGLTRSLNDESAAHALLRRIFWDEQTGAATILYSRCSALPNGLPGTQRRLIRPHDVRYELFGCLTDERVLLGVGNWRAWLRKQIAASQCADREKVVRHLSKLNVKLLEGGSRLVKLETVLGWERESEACLELDRAAQFADVLFQDPLWSDDQGESIELKTIRPVLSEFVFPAVDGSRREAKYLLISDFSPDERWKDIRDSLDEEERLARFAPKQRTLGWAIANDAQSVQSLRLFRECRGQFGFNVREDELVDWAIRASGYDEKSAVVHYLSHGRRADRLKAALRLRGLVGTWLAGLENQRIFQTGDEIEAEARNELERAAVQRGRAAAGDRILQRVAQWWSRDGRRLLRAQQHLMFDFDHHGVLLADFDPADMEQRTAWMRLFVLGMDHTLGRTRAGGDVGFLQFCDMHGWVRRFVDAQGAPGRWEQILHDYLEPQVEESKYLHWMRLFVGIFAMAERLQDYAHSFLSIDRYDHPFSLMSITCPRTSQEAPVDPPPVARILGMGACFIVRELLRHRVLTTQFAFEHAFVPSLRVRNLFRELGCEFEEHSGRSWEWSRDIWRFLKERLADNEDRTFGLAFDLPFQVLAANPNECQRVLDIQLPPDAEAGESW